jgi:hypothetical protein
MERAFEEKSFHLGNACKYLFNCISFPVTSSNFLVKRSHDVDCDELSHLITSHSMVGRRKILALHFILDLGREYLQVSEIMGMCEETMWHLWCRRHSRMGFCCFTERHAFLAHRF